MRAFILLDVRTGKCPEVVGKLRKIEGVTSANACWGRPDVFVVVDVPNQSVLSGFRESTAQGLLLLILGAVGLIFWTLYVRVLLEVLIAVFRLAENVSRIANRSGQP